MSDIQITWVIFGLAGIVGLLCGMLIQPLWLALTIGGPLGYCIGRYLPKHFKRQ